MEFVELKQLVESKAKSIEALTNESTKSWQRFTVLGNEISDLKDTVFTLAQIASDHEKQKLKRRINQLEEGDRP